MTALHSPIVILKSGYRLSAALLFCLFVVSTCLAADSALDIPASIQRVMGTRKTAVGLPNFGQVTPNLFRGAQPENDGYKTLQSMGIHIVVDMRGNKRELSVVEKLGMQYVSLPWSARSPSDEIMARFLQVIEANPDKKIFVHCRIGVDRTGMAIASYRMAKEGWSADEALKEMKIFGFNKFHQLNFRTLVRFQREFPQRLKTRAAYKQLQALER